MNDKSCNQTADEGASNSSNLKCSKTRSPVRTKRKRTNGEIDELDIPEKKGTVDETGVRFDLKPRWRRVVVHGVKQDTSDVATERFIYRSRGNSHTPEIILKNSVIDDASECQSQHTPRTPTFRQSTTHPHKEELHGDSPSCVISGSNNSDSLYLCHRSLAWSDDEWSDDESIDQQATNSAFVNLKGDVLPHHPLIANNAIEPMRFNCISPPQLVGKQNLDCQPLAVSWYQHPDSPQNTSEIFWEEKVLDVLDLERMAKLAI